MKNFPEGFVPHSAMQTFFISSMPEGREVMEMPTYILLLKLTDRGIQEIRRAPQRISEAMEEFKHLGGNVMVFFPVMGDYDYVAVGDAPDDKVAMTFILWLGSRGDVRTTTLRAFGLDSFTHIIERLKAEHHEGKIPAGRPAR
jgi:uncharacterized protein with GYD domain